MKGSEDCRDAMQNSQITKGEHKHIIVSLNAYVCWLEVLCASREWASNLSWNNIFPVSEQLRARQPHSGLVSPSSAARVHSAVTRQARADAAGFSAVGYVKPVKW